MGTMRLLTGRGEVPMDSALFVNDRAEFWPLDRETDARAFLHDARVSMEGWGLPLNWDKAQLLVQGLANGCKSRFPNKGNFWYAGRLVHGIPVAK